MARTLGAIPADSAIVEADGTVTTFFRLLWETLRTTFQNVGTVASVRKADQTAALVTASAYTTQAEALYRVSWYLRKTIADGVNSSLTITLGWTNRAVALTEAGAALVTDSVLAQQSGSKVVRADAASDLTYAVAYASNTPAKMTYDLDVSVELLQA
jgi:hypothetical protein